MTNSVSYLAAFGGGVASFVSPCVLPIIPGYLSVLTGLDLTDAVQDRAIIFFGLPATRRCSWSASPSCSCSWA